MIRGPQVGDGQLVLLLVRWNRDGSLKAVAKRSAALLSDRMRLPAVAVLV